MINPGQSLTVTVVVSPNGAFQQVTVIGSDPVGFSQTLTAPPFQFSVQIPSNVRPGTYTLTASGLVTPGQVVNSDPIGIIVERPDTPVSLRVEPSVLQLAFGHKGYLRVLATFGDGTTIDLTQSSLTAFSQPSPVANVGAYGIVTPVAAGSAYIGVTYRSLTANVPVTVLPLLKVAPPQKYLYASQQQQFITQTTALTAPSVAWSISPAGVGSVDGTGLYTGPSPVQTQQYVTITATNTADNTQFAIASVILMPPLAVNVTPAVATLTASQTQLFGAAVTNAPMKDVVWSCTAGNVDDNGLYTAPASIASQQTVTITATSIIDVTKIGSATVTLMPSQVAPTATFTGAPGAAAYLSTFAVIATTNASTPATITASGACSVSGNLVTMTRGTGACQLTANWPADQNYLASSATQSVIAAKAAATATLNAVSLSQIYDGTAKSVTSTTSPIGLIVSTTYNGLGAAPVNSGNYAVVAAIADSNYQGNASGTLQVSKAPLTVTASNVSRPYGAANPTFTASYSGFVNGDTSATAVSGVTSLTTSATSTSLPGGYPIVAAAATLTSANYAFNFLNGTLTVTATAPAPASGTTCNGAYNGTFNGNLTLLSGQVCIFVSGGTTGSVTGQGSLTLTGSARVNGNVALTGGQFTANGGASVGGSVTLSTGGSLALGNAGVGGSLTMSNGQTFSIGPGATINGSVTIQSEPATAAPSQIYGTTVKGSLTLQTNGGAIQIGSGNASTCAGNAVGGNTTVQVNTGSMAVSANTIKGVLVCQSNSSITGSGNVAALKQGQCAGF